MLKFLGILLLTTVCWCRTSEIPVDAAVSVIVELAKVFRVGGVFLLASREQVPVIQWANISANLSRNKIPTAIMSLKSALYTPVLLDWPTLYVMFSAGFDISALQQLSSLPGLSIPLWLLFFEEEQTVEEFFGDVHIPFNCRFLVAQLDGDMIQLLEVYRVTRHFALTIAQYGVWKDGALIDYKLNFYDGRNNLQGFTMTAISMDSLPYSDLREENGTYVLGGSMAPLWKMLEDRLNFTYVTTDKLD
ncbi:hypothetical protein ANN_10511 [Periplaneta americana]|uniref:Uncharacterized protein n=1 Tax=Periplaneta americana TaxID=6978 RepID=A0ABQ8TPA2_PERAM|nr:hypothetical protein ANN_10511 [Periplaneta americana]